MSFAHFVDSIVGIACLVMVCRRYRGESIRVTPADMVLWTFAVFLVLPLFLDSTDFVQAYRLYPELGNVGQLPDVHIITAIIILVATFAITRTVRHVSTLPMTPIVVPHRWIWLLGSLCPLAVVALAPHPGVYSQMAAVISQIGPGQEFFASYTDPSPTARYHVYVTWSTIVSTVSLTVWLMSRHRNSALFMILPIGFMDFWINGKRNIIALLLVQLVFAIGRNRVVDRRTFRRYVAVGALLLAVLLGVSNWFQNQYRAPVVASDSSEVFKIDFGRTDVIHLAVAGQLGDAREPLQFPGQSLVLHVDAAMARVTGGQKDVTYPDRVTSIAKSQPIQSTPGSITTTIMSEAIDNFGWFGMLIGPIFLILMIRWSAKVTDPILSLMIALLTTLLIVTSILAAVPLIGLVLGRAILARVSKRRVDRAASDRDRVANSSGVERQATSPGLTARSGK